MENRGRKPIADPRDTSYLVRVNRKELDILEKVRKSTGMSAADVFRTALEKMYHAEGYEE